jgi:hypothetical protein
MASAASRRLLRELPSQDEMNEIISNLKEQSPQGLALMGAAYLDNSLERLILAHFIPLTTEDRHRFFDGGSNAILGPLSAKIRMAYALGGIGKIVYSDLLLINEIRNVFAHSLHRVTFNNDLIIRDCAKLQSYRRFWERQSLPMPYGDDPITFFAESIFIIYCILVVRVTVVYARPPLKSPDEIDDITAIARKPVWLDKSE